MPEKKIPLMEIRNLKKYFPVRQGILSKNKLLKAVDDISFSIDKGETLGLVGESGCGKTTIGRTIIRLYEPTDGAILYKGIDISRLSQKELKPFRKRIQMVFQDPYSALNESMTIQDIIGEPLEIYKSGFGKNRKKINDLLENVGLSRYYSDRYPIELSGGERQRVAIARALALEPDLIICDEPISSLDASIGTRMIHMLLGLQQLKKLTYIFITHDLAVAKHISDRIAVMYLGKIVEIARTEALFRAPAHPYTLALLSAIPRISFDTQLKKRIIMKGEVPSPIHPPLGCCFNTRCQNASDICMDNVPMMREIAPEHFAACHFL